MKHLFPAISAIALIAACSGEKAATPADTAQPAAVPPVIQRAAAPTDLLLPLPASTSADIAAADLAVRIEALASDTFEGRGPGSVTGEASADWVAAEMERIGLEPGADGEWFQTVKMVEQSIDPDASSIAFTTPDGVQPLALKDEAVIWTKRQLEDTVAIDASDVVFVGYGVNAPEYGWNDYAGLDVAGKTVIILVNDPGFATEDPELFKGKSMTYYGRWTYKYEEAARQGAAAAIIVHETDPASYGWDVVANSWSGAQADLVRADGGADRVVMEGWIQRDIAVALFASAGLDFEAQKEAAKTRGFTYVPLTGVTASGQITQTVTQATSRNVVGILPGTARPDEFVMYVAHWDHLGKKDTFLDDDIFNGAVDNATGTAALLEIAEAMAQAPRERSVIFLAVTLEESGLLGSAYYAENPTVDLAQVVAGINMDGMLPIGRTRDMVVIGAGASELEDILADVISAQNRVVRPDLNPQAGYFYRSDHISLAKKGVPMLYADGGFDKIDGGMAAGEAMGKTYVAVNYHKVGDEYSPDWDLSGMVEDVQALYEVGTRIANGDNWPNWYDGNEFRSLRDAQRGGK